MSNDTKQKAIVAGRAPDGVDAGSRAPYEAGMRDRAKIMDLDVDADRIAATGATEGNGGGGNVEELPAEMRRAGIDPRKAAR
ncbi:MAG: hypothetical protein JWO51_1696 [Rhodospirillales bacterium]|nr:hypothetical protein [Rhodospirillales bacterium]